MRMILFECVPLGVAVCVYACVRVGVSIQVCVSVCVYVCARASVCVCVCVCVWVGTCARVQRSHSGHALLPFFDYL